MYLSRSRKGVDCDARASRPLCRLARSVTSGRLLIGNSEQVRVRLGLRSQPVGRRAVGLFVRRSEWGCAGDDTLGEQDQLLKRRPGTTSYAFSTAAGKSVGASGIHATPFPCNTPSGQRADLRLHTLNVALVVGRPRRPQTAWPQMLRMSRHLLRVRILCNTSTASRGQLRPLRHNSAGGCVRRRMTGGRSSSSSDAHQIEHRGAFLCGRIEAAALFRLGRWKNRRSLPGKVNSAKVLCSIWAAWKQFCCRPSASTSFVLPRARARACFVDACARKRVYAGEMAGTMHGSLLPRS